MKPGQRRVLPDSAEGRLFDLIEAAKMHFRAKVEDPFRIIKMSIWIPEGLRPKHPQT